MLAHARASLMFAGDGIGSPVLQWGRSFTTSNPNDREGLMAARKITRNSASTEQEDLRANFWRTAKRAARQVPFMEDVVAAYYCALDRDTPAHTKGILFAALAYFVLPADAIPDILLGLGFTDDVAVLSAAIAAVKSQISPAHRLAAKKALKEQA
jgi:uncharacterized membrane protein YkvA (DUF1232 family)